MAVADRIRELASDQGLNMKDFSALIDVSERTIQNYLAGISLPNGRFLIDLSEKIGASPAWVLVGEGPKYLRGNHQNVQSAASSDFVSIPRYSVEASAGPGTATDCEEATGFYAFNRKWLVRRGLNPANLAVIGVRGDSGEPYLSDGDLILVNMAETKPIDGLTYAIRLGNDLVVKSVQRIGASRIALLSANPLYPPREIDLGELDGDTAIIGRLVTSMHQW